VSTPETELSDIAELDQLATANREHLARIEQAGHTIQNAATHYIICLLESLLASSTIDLLTKPKLDHERWMAAQLDAADRSIASVAEARRQHQEAMNREAIKRGAPTSVPGPQPVLKNADLLSKMVARTDPKPPGP